MISTHRALSHQFGLLGGTDDASQALRRVLGPLAATARDDDHGRAVYGVRATRSAAEAFVDDTWFEARDLGDAIARVLTIINVRAIDSAATPVVHAAVVADGRRAVALVGRPGAGKSTACTRLVHDGFRYVSDETLVLADSRGNVAPYAKPIVISPSSAADIAASVVDLDLGLGRLGQLYIDARSLPGGVVDVAPRLAVVIDLSYEQGATMHLEELSPGATAAIMASNMFDLRRGGRSALELVAEVATDVSGWRLRHGGGREVLDAVRRALAG